MYIEEKLYPGRLLTVGNFLLVALSSLTPADPGGVGRSHHVTTLRPFGQQKAGATEIRLSHCPGGSRSWFQSSSDGSPNHAPDATSAKVGKVASSSLMSALRRASPGLTRPGCLSLSTWKSCRRSESRIQSWPPPAQRHDRDTLPSTSIPTYLTLARRHLSGPQSPARLFSPMATNPGRTLMLPLHCPATYLYGRHEGPALSRSGPPVRLQGAPASEPNPWAALGKSGCLQYVPPPCEIRIRLLSFPRLHQCPGDGPVTAAPTAIVVPEIGNHTRGPASKAKSPLSRSRENPSPPRAQVPFISQHSDPIMILIHPAARSVSPLLVRKSSLPPAQVHVPLSCRPFDRAHEHPPRPSLAGLRRLPVIPSRKL